MCLAGLLGLSWDVDEVMDGEIWGMTPEQCGFWGCPNEDPSFQQGLGPAILGCLHSAGQAAFGKHLKIPFPAPQEPSAPPSCSHPLPPCLSHSTGRLPEDKTFTNTPRF